MCVGSPAAGAWSSFQRRPDDEFETDSFEPLLMPVVHALIQVREDIENLVARVLAEHT